MRTATNPSTGEKKPDLGASWLAAGLECPADACVGWVRTKKPPLHYEPMFSDSPIDVRLANMTAALDAGADPNEVDHELSVWQCLGRPLHCCVGGFNAWGPPSVVRDNLPLIELLLSRGADPRLPGPAWSEVYRVGRPRHPSPLELVREEIEDPEDRPDDWETVLMECGFYGEAYTLLKAAAESLDGESLLGRTATP